MKLSLKFGGGDIFPGFDVAKGLFGKEPFNLLNSIISIAIAILTVVAGIWFLFLLITGAIGIMNAGGDKGAVADAQKKITMGFVGLVIVVAGIFIADLIGTIFGIDILNPGGILENLTP